MANALLIVCVGLLFNAVVARECDSSDGVTLGQCGTTVTDCVGAAGFDLDDICECYGNYNACLDSVDCIGTLKNASDTASVTLCDGLIG